MKISICCISFAFFLYYSINLNKRILIVLGQLRPYSLQDSSTIEHAWRQHEEEIQLMISGRHYLIDLQQLQQINEETNQARFIKRIVAPDTSASAIEYVSHIYCEKKNSHSILLVRLINQRIKIVN